MVSIDKKGLENEKLAYEYLKKRFDKVIWLSEKRPHSFCDFVAIKDKKRFIIEVRTRPRIEPIRKEYMLDLFDKENIIILVINKDKSFKEYSINEVKNFIKTGKGRRRPEILNNNTFIGKIQLGNRFQVPKPIKDKLGISYNDYLNINIEKVSQ